jgi:hypothetical protein
MQGHTSKGEADGEGPAWAPLRDNYMLTNSKLKDWDKMLVRIIFIYIILNVMTSRVQIPPPPNGLEKYELTFFTNKKKILNVTLVGY